jgi:ubiquitin carboxyl-terminal hydrolase 9/13
MNYMGSLSISESRSPFFLNSTKSSPALCSGPHHGHYVSIIKANGSWKIFDDDTVDTIKESDIPKYFGDSNNGAAYVLYYQAVDMDLSALGLQRPTPAPATQPVPDGQPEDLSIPVLPPGLISENDTSDAAESSGPTTPTASNSGHSPKTNGSPAPVILNTPPSDMPPSMPSIPPAMQQKPGGGLFQSLRHMPSSRIRSTVGTSEYRTSLLDAASTVASSSSTQSPAARPNLIQISRPESMHGTAGGSVPPPSESPAFSSLPRGKTLNERDGWMRRKSFRHESEKDKERDRDTLAATFAAIRLDKAKNKQDSPTWLHGEHSPHADMAKVSGRQFQAPPPISITGSTSRDSGSSSRHAPSPEFTRRGDAPDEPPPLLFRRPSLARPSTAGARLARSASPLRDVPGSGLNDSPLTPLRHGPPDSPRTHRSPQPIPSEKRREGPATYNKLPSTNGNEYRKRPSSAHANVSPTHARYSSPRPTKVAGPNQPVCVSSKSTANGSSSSSSNTIKSSLKRFTTSVLGFGKKDKHQDKFRTVLASNSPV